MLSCVFYVYTIISIMIFGVDIALYLRENIRRFHIGQLEYDVWKNSVLKVVKKWSRKTPVVRRNDTFRYTILDIVSGKYKSAAVQDFQTASLLIALSECGNYANVLEHHLNNGKWRKKHSKPDTAMLAYAMIKNNLYKKDIKEAMDYTYKIILDSIDEFGIVSYTGNKKDKCRFVDVLGMACPFLARYANEYKCKEAENISFKQLEFYHDNGMFENTSLPNHAIDKETKLPLGVYGWGRGTAWYIIGLLDTYEEVQNDDYKKKIKKWIYESAEYLKKFQSDGGGFNSILQLNRNFDSSVTAVLSWFYYKSAYIFSNNDYASIANNALESIRKVTRIDGAVDYSQGDTKDVGIFSQNYSVMPFTQGFTLRAIIAKEKYETFRTL